MTANLVFIQSTARSGTTWLKTTLASHPATKLYGEFLHPSMFGWGLFSYYDQHIREDPAKLLPLAQKQMSRDYLHWLAEKTPEKTVLLDLKLEQLEDVPSASAGIYQSRGSFIVLKRLNLLKQAVSAVVMSERLKAGDSVVHRDHTPEVMRVEVDPANILARMRIRRDLFNKYLERLRVSRRSHMIVNYEELTGPNGGAALDRIQRFVGLEPVPLRSTLAKQNPANLEEIVVNYDELLTALKASEFDYTLWLPN